MVERVKKEKNPLLCLEVADYFCNFAAKQCIKLSFVRYCETHEEGDGCIAFIFYRLLVCA